MKTPQEYGYVLSNNLCLFQKGPLSQWWGGFESQSSTFRVEALSPLLDKILSPHTLVMAETWSSCYNSYSFNCCEQWMMAWKALTFGDIESFHKIMSTQHPQVQKDYGRKVKNFDPDLWDAVKYDIVYAGNFLKFDQNTELREFLQSFHRFTIFAEASPWDKVWGIGLGPDSSAALDIYQWQGENLLGQALSEIRKSI